MSDKTALEKWVDQTAEHLANTYEINKKKMLDIISDYEELKERFLIKGKKP